MDRFIDCQLQLQWRTKILLLKLRRQTGQNLNLAVV